MQACWSSSGAVVEFRPSASLRSKLARLSTGKAQQRRRRARAARVFLTIPKPRPLPALPRTASAA